MTIRYSPLVRDALDHGYPVVALETGIITHALPRPLNLETARAVQEQLTAAGVVPATMGFIDGQAVIGLTDEELVSLAEHPEPARITVRDLPIAQTRGLTGGIALAAALHLAHRAKIQVCATTGLGGVHRAHSPATALQESSDLMALSQHPVVVVTAGVRPMLDVAATMERLETMGVPVLGYRSAQFAGFYVPSSGYPVDHRVEDADQIAEIAKARDSLGLSQAILVSNPVQAELAVHDYEQHLEEAAEIAAQYADGGEDDTQVLLVSLEEATGGEAWKVNTEIYRRNVALGAQIAKALATTPHYTD